MKRLLHLLGPVAATLLLIAACSDDSSSDGSGAGGNASGGAGGAACFEASGGYGPFMDLCIDETADTACVTCARANCCTEVEACPANSDCACLLDCFLGGCDPVECLTICGQSGPTNDLIQCATNSCGDECVGQ